MNEHTGWHEYKDGKRFNPECPACVRANVMYPIRQVISTDTLDKLVEYQRSEYGQKLTLLPPQEKDIQVDAEIESLEEIDKIIRRAPSRSRK